MTPRVKKKHLSPAVLEEAAKAVADLAVEAGVRAALLGGYAMQMYGSDRLTGDIDFVSEAWIPGIRHGKPLSFGGEATKAPNGAPLDLILRDDDFTSLYEDAVEKSSLIKGMRGVRIVRPEHLAAIKLASGRDRDESDLLFLIQEKVPNVATTRKIVKEHLGAYAAQEFDRYVGEAVWRRR